MRMMRRAGLIMPPIKIPTLAELFADMTQLSFANGSASTASYTITASLSGIDTSIPFYCFCSTGSDFEISRIVGLNKTQLLISGTRVVTVTNNSVAISDVRGGSIILARFPNYKPNAINKALSTMTFNVKASRYSSTSSNCSFDYSTNPVNSNAMYIATGSTGGFSVSKGSSILTPIFSTGSVVYLMKTTSVTVYRYSGNGSTSSNLYVASIFELLDAV